MSDADGVRRLAAADRPRLVELARVAFASDGFYRRAFGFSARQFEAYWHAYFRLVLDDANAGIYALEKGGALAVAVAIGFAGFPDSRRWRRFSRELLLAVGPLRWYRHERFVEEYGRVMQRPPDVRRAEAQVLWLLGRPSGISGLGSAGLRLAREAVAAYRPPEVRLLTGFIDAGNPALLKLCRRFGFEAGPPVEVCGRRGRRIELWLPA
jgi:hypothetical protein